LAATTLLILYLFSIRYHISLPVATFWVAVGLMLGIVVYQSTQSKLSSHYAKVILCEIAVTCLVFHLIYQIPYYGLHGADAYRIMAPTKAILLTGFIGGDPAYMGTASYFPIISILGAQLSLITNIDLFSVVKWFPSLMDVALILLLYLLVRSIFKQEKIALLSALLFACLQNHMLLGSLFTCQNVALILMVCCIYLYFSARASAHQATYRALSVMCLLAVVLAHHLTSFMLLMFLLIHFLVAKASETPFLRRTYFADNVAGEKIASSFLSLAFVAPFAYWMYVQMSPFYTLVSFTRELFIPSQTGAATYSEIAYIGTASIETIRGHIVFYGFYSFLVIFGIILLYGLLSRHRNDRIEASSFTLFLFLCGIGGLIMLYVVPLGVGPFPHRFLTFGWLFGFAPLAAIILKERHKWLRRVGIFLLIAFMLFNIYQIEPTAWDARAEGVTVAPSRQDYALARTFDFSTGEIIAQPNNLLAIYDVHNNPGDSAAWVNTDLSEYDWIIIHKEALRWEKESYPETRSQAIAEMEELMERDSPERNKIYESNNLSVFKPRQ